MDEAYVLRLYVCGASPASARARLAVERLCHERLAGRHHLEVIDVIEQPERAESERILATPTLVREVPQPRRRVVGDLSDQQALLLGLDLEPGPTSALAREE